MNTLLIILVLLQPPLEYTFPESYPVLPYKLEEIKPAPSKESSPVQEQNHFGVQAPRERKQRALLFTASWCKPCQALKRGLLADLKKQGWEIGVGDWNHIQVFEISNGANKPSVRAFNITSVPTIIWFNSQQPRSIGLQGVNVQGWKALWNSAYPPKQGNRPTGGFTQVLPVYTAPTITHTVPL